MGSFTDVHMESIHQEMPPTRLESVSSTRGLVLLAAALLAGQTAAWTYRSARGAGIWSIGRKHDAPVPRQGDEDEEEPRSRVVLVLDVDGTLYDQTAGVETQVSKTMGQMMRFCVQRSPLASADSDHPSILLTRLSSASSSSGSGTST